MYRVVVNVLLQAIGSPFLETRVLYTLEDRDAGDWHWCSVVFAYLVLSWR
jgi:hypothetical protein